MALAMTAMAQDTIIFRNGDIKSVKVTEVSKSQIKYLLWDSQDGPVYVQEVSDIFMVKYHNGRKELFNQNNQEERPGRQNVKSSAWYGYMDRYGGFLVINNRRLALNEEQIVLGPQRYSTYISATKQYSGGGLCVAMGFVTAIVGTGCLFYGMDEGNQAEQLIIPAICMLALSDVLLPVGFVLRGIGRGRLNWVVDDYNREQRQISQRVSLSMGPSLISSPSAAGTNYTMGAGLQLHF